MDADSRDLMLCDIGDDTFDVPNAEATLAEHFSIHAVIRCLLTLSARKSLSPVP